MYIEILDVFYKLAKIVSVSIMIAKEVKNYIKGKNNLKKDQSSSLAVPDGLNGD